MNGPIENSSNRNAFINCNQGIANGFGAMFFNLRDPNFKQTNQPIKKNSSMHIVILISTIIYVACLIVGVVGLDTFLPLGATIGMIVGPYCLYLLLSICCSELREYLSNMKKFDGYQETYNQMVKGKGFFKFWIVCYHYETIQTKDGVSQRKVVTHTAEEIFTVTDCADESGEISSIKDVRSFVFIHYLKRYYFTDDVSQNKFIAAFNSFVWRNTRDFYQDFDHEFDINGFEEYAAFTALGDNDRSLASFYICTFLGLALPYACIIEKSIARYDVGLLKRLTI